MATFICSPSVRICNKATAGPTPFITRLPLKCKSKAAPGQPQIRHFPCGRPAPLPASGRESPPRGPKPQDQARSVAGLSSSALRDSVWLSGTGLRLQVHWIGGLEDYPARNACANFDVLDSAVAKRVQHREERSEEHTSELQSPCNL